VLLPCQLLVNLPGAGEVHEDEQALKRVQEDKYIQHTC
jgi:hypothetical protein